MTRRMMRDHGRLLRAAVLLSLGSCTGGAPADGSDGPAAETPSAGDARALPQRKPTGDLTTSGDVEWIDEIGWGGSGCKGDVNVLQDRYGLQMFYTDFKLQREASETGTSKMSQCPFFLSFSKSKSQVRLRGITLLGSAYLPAGSKASYVVKYGSTNFQSIKSSTALPTASGPVLGSWQYSYDDVQTEWSQCGKSPPRIYVMMELRLDSASFASTKVSDVILNIESRPCTP